MIHPAFSFRRILSHLGALGGPRKPWGGLRLGDLGTGQVRNMLYKLVPETKSKAHRWLRVGDLGTDEVRNMLCTLAPETNSKAHWWLRLGR